MSELISGRKEPCKDNLGGIKKIYLIDYVNYPNHLMTGYKNMLLTSFPTSLIFDYEGTSKNANENLNGDAYSQNISFKMSKQDIVTNQNVMLLFKKRVRAITVDWKGKIKIYGLHNGLDVSVNITTGNSRNSFGGYKLLLEGKEQYQAPFINFLEDAGFYTEGVLSGCLLSSSGKAASLADLVSSCSVQLNEKEKPIFLSSSGKPSSVGYLTSTV